MKKGHYPVCCHINKKIESLLIFLLLIGVCCFFFGYSTEDNIKKCQLETDGICLTDTSFSYQTLCVHHDNFHRYVESYDLGDNGDSRFPMSYKNMAIHSRMMVSE